MDESRSEFRKCYYFEVGTDGSVRKGIMVGEINPISNRLEGQIILPFFSDSLICIESEFGCMPSVYMVIDKNNVDRIISKIEYNYNLNNSTMEYIKKFLKEIK